jgi:hypothetical protein
VRVQLYCCPCCAAVLLACRTEGFVYVEKRSFGLSKAAVGRLRKALFQGAALPPGGSLMAAGLGSTCCLTGGLVLSLRASKSAGREAKVPWGGERGPCRGPSTRPSACTRPTTDNPCPPRHMGQTQQLCRSAVGGWGLEEGDCRQLWVGAWRKAPS